ncbi:MAG: DUF4251 domain-containing protein [Bacteroides sp.]|nr:DUF4251 domain-containing protein [Bacteroides sp.]
MKQIVILMALLLATLTAGAQNERRIYTSGELKAMQRRTERKATREQQKQAQAIQDSIYYAKALRALENLDFVVEADQLVFKRGQTAFVSSMTNFISLSDEKAVVQVAHFNGGGPNGVGGVTVEGRASNILTKMDKKGNVTFNMSVMGTGISASVRLQLYKGSNRVSVTVSPNFSSNTVTLNGKLLPTEWSSVYKGSSL